jgi:hypothetical protein
MGKKTNTTKTEAPAKRALVSKPAAEKAAPEKAVAAEPPPAKPTAVKSVGAKPKTATRAPKSAPARKKKPAYTQEDIALRAYYIAERRQAAGIYADPHHDWIEAERQLAYEAGTTVAKAKKAKS